MNSTLGGILFGNWGRQQECLALPDKKSDTRKLGHTNQTNQTPENSARQIKQFKNMADKSDNRKALQVSKFGGI